MTTKKLEGLEGLKQKYSVFSFRNRSTTESRRIALKDGDSVQIQSGGLGKALSSMFDQLPSFSDFEPVVPTTEELIEAGVIKTRNSAAPKEDVVTDTDPAPKQSGGSTSPSKDK
jgi:hypothetical protein